MKCGIYKIENSVTQDFYIGSSQNIEKRWKTHIRDLNKNKHHNLFLQRCWNKYGQESFVFSVVEEVPIELLLSTEQTYLDQKISLYNIGVTAAGGDNISNHPEKLQIIEKMKSSLHKTLSNRTKLEWAEIKEKFIGAKNSQFGVTWSVVRRAKASKSKKKVLSIQSK